MPKTSRATAKRRQRARPLVGGFLERISVKVLEKYHQEITNLAKGEHGVYALYKKDRLYYVGLAVDLRRRIKQHLKDKHAGRWNRFSLYLVHIADHIREIETLLLRIADPKGNRHAGRLDGATNLERRLRSMMEAKYRSEVAAIFSDRSGRRRPARGPTRDKPRAAKKSNRPLRGTIAAGKRIYVTYKGKDYIAQVSRNGGVRFNGVVYDNPSAAGRAITKRPLNGWSFWRFRHEGELVRLNVARKRMRSSK